MAPRRGRLLPGQLEEAGASIRGPASAMTAFLREQGITAQRGLPRNVYARMDDSNTSTPAPGSAPTSDAGTPDNDSDAPIASTSASASASTSAAPSTAGSKRGGAKLTPAQLKKQKMAAAAEAGVEFHVGGTNMAAPSKGRYEDRKAPGSITQCAECGKKFTVSKYTSSNPHGPGVLCGPCSNAIGGGIAAATAPKPKKAPLKKKAVKAPEERELKPVTTLQQTCISVIGAHIDRVEALGDVGPKNLDYINRIVCKHRALTADNLGLFLEVDHKELRFYDCTNLNDEQLASIAIFCPHLERIDLQFCGLLDDDVLRAWAEGFRELKYLSLYGPYLATPKGWNHFFTTLASRGQQLEGFGIRQSARFDDDNLKTLVQHNPNLYNLQLSEIGKLNESWLPLMYPLKNLTTLDISRAGVVHGTVLNDDAVVALIEQVGENLVDLVLDDNHLLTDRVLVEGVKVHCPRLRRLGLEGMHLIQSKGVEDLFTDWVNTGLTHLNLKRCLQIEDDALDKIVEHSCESLRVLDVHSVDELGDDALKRLANGAPKLEWVDVSYVRAVDDFVVKEFLDKLDGLKYLFVHGCNRVTDSCPHKRGASIRGLENAVLQDMPHKI